MAIAIAFMGYAYNYINHKAIEELRFATVKPDYANVYINNEIKFLKGKQ